MTHQYWTDRLINHIRTCPECKSAQAARIRHTCQRRQELVKLTLKERHAD